ncbi:MAG: 50S ribosomal protein L31, partial [Burkholderiaceae bacterium]
MTEREKTEIIQGFTKLFDFQHVVRGEKRRQSWRLNFKDRIMKEGIHPNYRDVVFVDVSNGFQFITRSTVQTRE